MSASTLSYQQQSLMSPLSTADLSPTASQPTHIRPVPSGKPPPPTIPQPEPHPSINLAYDCDLHHMHPSATSSSTHPTAASSSSLSQPSTHPQQVKHSLAGSSGAGVSLPPDVSTALQQIVSQLDVITKTLSLFDQRLRQHEEKVQRIEQRQNDAARAGVRAAIDREMDKLHSLPTAPSAPAMPSSFAASDLLGADVPAARTARTPPPHADSPASH